MDDNLFHTSTEGKALEDPKNSAPEFIFQRTFLLKKHQTKKQLLKLVLKIVNLFQLMEKNLILQTY